MEGVKPMSYSIRKFKFQKDGTFIVAQNMLSEKHIQENVTFKIIETLRLY